jgi:hypothetical protein
MSLPIMLMGMDQIERWRADPDEYWEAHPEPSDAQLDELAATWIRYQSVDRPDVDDADPDWWACEVVMDLYGERPDIEWRLVRALCARVDPSDELTVTAIGAGPLEDFVRHQGERALDLIEPVADTDPVLLDALECVWGWDEPWRSRLNAYLEARGRGTR